MCIWRTWSIPRAPAGGLQKSLPCPAPSPLNLLTWEAALVPHPDHQFTAFILQGLRHGFRVGFDPRVSSLRLSKRNIPSAYVVEQYLKNECALGRVLGPFPGYLPGLHTSRFGVIPKKSQPGKWRLIIDLSAPLPRVSASMMALMLICAPCAIHRWTQRPI